MPLTAQKVTEFGGVLPDQLTGSQLGTVIDCLRGDLPGAVEFVEQAAAKARDADAFTYVSQAPADLSSKEEWDQLVGRLSRLFASPFVAIIREWARRQYGTGVAFVNCCIVAGEPGEIDKDALWRLQTTQQVTPDC